MRGLLSSPATSLADPVDGDNHQGEPGMDPASNRNQEEDELNSDYDDSEIGGTGFMFIST